MKKNIKKILNKIIGTDFFIETRYLDYNEFLNWLGFANAGMLNPGNIYCFD